MATGDSEETFRMSGMDCSEEVAAIGRREAASDLCESENSSCDRTII